MNGRHADLSAGERTDVEVEFVSRRTVEAGGKRVHRLLVEDGGGDRFAVLVSPDSGLLLGLKTGAIYEFADLLASQPVERAGEDEADDEAIEHREHAETTAGAVDLALSKAGAALGIHDAFGVVDEQTTVQRVRADSDAVDGARMDGGGYAAATGIAPSDVDALRSFLDEHDDAPAFSVEYADECGSHERLAADVCVLERTVRRPAAAVAVECVGLPNGPDTDSVRFDHVEFVEVADAPPELYEVSDGTPAERATAMAELGDVAPDRVPVADALDLLESESGTVREDALRALEAAAVARPEDCIAAVPELVALLDGGTNETRALAAVAAIASEHPETVAPHADALRTHLDGDDGGRTSKAARCLSEVAGHDPADVVDATPALASLAADRDRGFEHALFALNRISAEYPAEVRPAAGTLQDALADESLAPGPRLNATAALGRVAGKFPDAAVDAVEELCGLLDADDDRLQANAAGVLGDVATVHAHALRPHVDAVAALLDGDDEYALANAAAALARVAAADPGVVEHLADRFEALLDHDHRLVRLNACWVLGHVGAEQAVPSLEGVATTDGDDRVRDRAAWALAEIQPAN